MKPELVVIRDVTSIGLIRCVCHANEKKVFVTSESAFRRMEYGDRTIFPIGFDRESVFIYDGGPLPEKIDWNKMLRWKGPPVSSPG